MLAQKLRRELPNPAPENSVEARPLASCQGSVAWERVRAAQAGDARALSHILSALVAYFRGRYGIPRCYAVFCADCFKALREDPKAWGRTFEKPGADEEFRNLDRSRFPAEQLMLGHGPRLSEARLRRIGSAARRAFYLTGRPATGTEVRAITMASESESSPTGDSFQTLRLQNYVDLAARKIVQAARFGDPGALRDLLLAGEGSLRMEAAISASVARSVAGSLKALLKDRQAWAGVKGSRADGEQSSRPSSNELAAFGRGFCRAFHLSKPQGRLKSGESPKTAAATPSEVYTIKRLLQHGVSRRKALEIVSRAYTGYSIRTLDEWVRFREIRPAQPGTLGEWDLMVNRLHLAVNVLRETNRGQGLEGAYLEAARWLAQKLFPSMHSQMESWAARVLKESKKRRRRPARHVELAEQIKRSLELEGCPPPIPEDLLEEVIRQVSAEKAPSLLSETDIAKLVPAVRSAHAFALGLIDQSPQWARTWARLERRYSRLQEAS